jgi:hypothetical protein
MPRSGRAVVLLDDRVVVLKQGIRGRFTPGASPDVDGRRFRRFMTIHHEADGKIVQQTGFRGFGCVCTG